MEGSPSFPVIGWFDEPIKKSINSVFSGINTKVEALDLFKKYRAAHFGMLRELVGSVKVLGMSAPMKLLDFYYPTHVSPDIQRRLYQADWLVASEVVGQKHALALKKRVQDGTEFVEKNDRIVVLGGPGAGKTTFLRYLGLAFSDAEVFRSTKLSTSKFPIFVSLPHFAKSGKSIFDYVAEPLVLRTDEYARHFLKRVLERGMAIFFFDSLDEVPVSSRQNLIDEIRQISALYVGCKYVLSCRTADYQGGLETFSEVELCRLSKEAVRKIVRSWFIGAPESGRKLLRVIEDDPGFVNLTETPLLLSLLCIQYRHDLALPRRKSEIYKRCIDTLLRDWDASRGFRRESSYAQLSDEHKERYFENLAGRFLCESNSYIMPRARILDYSVEFLPKVGLATNDASGVLDEVESHHGILERYSVESYCFSHASFQEYFAARDAISRRSEIEVVKSHLDDDSWFGVIEFIVGLTPHTLIVSDILNLIIAKSLIGNLKNYPAITKRARLLHLLYRCLVVGPFLDPETRRRALDHLASSIVSFIKAMSDSGVYPLCAFNGSGIRNPYYFINKRPSLHDALLPFRKLLNEIVSNPLPNYVELALVFAREYENPGNIPALATLLNLIVPVSRAAPDDARRILLAVKSSGRFAWSDKIVEETLMSLGSG